MRNKLALRLARIPHPRLVLALLCIAIIAALGWQFGRAIIFPAQFSSSGVLETDEDNVATDTAGRVVELLVEEGDSVQAGQPLAKLDSVLLTAQVDQADAALAMAQANLVKLQNGARSEEILQAKAGLAQALARRDGAKNAYFDAQTLQSNPQTLNVQIAAARANLDAAQHRALAASYLSQAAGIESSYWDRSIGALTEGITVQTPQGTVTRYISSARMDELKQVGSAANAKAQSAAAAEVTAYAQRDGAQAAYNNLLQQQSNPLTLNLQTNQARANLDVAEAAVRVAQSKLDALNGGTRVENIAAAKAQVAQAQGARDSLKAQLDKMTLRAPRAGTVSQKLLHLGEMAIPGSAVYHVVNLDQLTLALYVPEDQVGKIKVGASTEIKVDAFPNRIFTGSANFVSPQAEFTPKNIATKDQRTTQVFAVKITIANGDHSLKPGMPADAIVH
jgi:HlyD family secretion protein